MSEDAELIRRLNRGDQKAYTILYQKYVGMVYGFLFKMLKDEDVAEDLTQFCFMQVWIHREKISFDRNIPAYLYVVARNAAYKEFRRQLTAETYVESSIHTDEQFSRENDGDIDFNLIRSEVDRVVDTLPATRKKIYIMSRIQGLTDTEIAERLGISPKTVDAQISRVKLAIRQAVSKIMILTVIATLS